MKKNNFERGRIDVFGIHTLDLGELKQIIIGHDNKGFGSAWFLDKVFIVNEDTDQRWMFNCLKWMDDSQGDKKVERALEPLNNNRITTYQIQVHTGKTRGSGTDANVFIVLHGVNGKTNELPLSCSNHTNKFEEGQCDIFAIDETEIGDLTTVTIRHDNAGLGSDWLLDQIDICDQANGKWYKFPANLWLDKAKGLSKTLKVAH